MTQGPFRPEDEDTAVASGNAEAQLPDNGPFATSTIVELPDEISDPAQGPMVDDQPADLSAFAELLSDSGIDTIWVDLDGDQIPETSITVSGPFQASAVDSGQADSLPVPSVDETPLETGDPFAYDSWITFSVEQDGAPIFDLSQLTPVSSTVDWTSDDARGYDPMALNNFSVANGPVMYDQGGQQAFSPVAYNDPGFYPQGPGAGYWDPSYAATPSTVDPSAWAPVPPGGVDPMAFNQMSGGYDPGMPAFTPYSFDPNNPLPTYTPAYPGFDPNNPLPTYTPYNGDPSSLPGYQAYLEATGNPPAGMPAMGPGMPGAGMPQVPGMADLGPGMPAVAPISPIAPMTSYTSGYDPTASTATDVVTSYYTDPTFDNQLSDASANSNFWMDQYDQASSLQSQYWQASVDASVAGDGLLAYDLNQLSLSAGDAASSAWSYSSTAYDGISTSGSSSASSSSADDGWYNAMSLDS